MFILSRGRCQIEPLAGSVGGRLGSKVGVALDVGGGVVVAVGVLVEVGVMVAVGVGD